MVENGEDPMRWEWTVASLAETELLGEAFGRTAEAGDLLALRGELGAGKTTFVRALARGMGVVGKIVSPSFTLHAIYAGRLELDHLDAYFQNRMTAFLSEGGEEFLHSRGVCAVEWAERAGAFLPPERLEVVLEHVADTSRRLVFQAVGARSIRWLHAAITSLDPIRFRDSP